MMQENEALYSIITVGEPFSPTPVPVGVLLFYKNKVFDKVSRFLASRLPEITEDILPEIYRFFSVLHSFSEREQVLETEFREITDLQLGWVMFTKPSASLIKADLEKELDILFQTFVANYNFDNMMQGYPSSLLIAGTRRLEA